MDRTMARVLGPLRAVAVRIAAQWSAHPLRAVDEVSGTPFTGDRRHRTKSAAIAALLLLTAAPATAQEPFSSVQHLLRRGDTVFVTDHNNGITKESSSKSGPRRFGWRWMEPNASGRRPTYGCSSVVVIP